LRQPSGSDSGRLFSFGETGGIVKKRTDKVTILDFARWKEKDEKIVMITAYDVLFARIFDEVGVDSILVGDSLGQVVLGLPNTLGVTMEDMVRHTGAAARGTRRAFLIADMPFLSYQPGPEEAIRNAGRLIQAGAEGVKLEGGRNVENTIRAIVRCDIPVMGHVGLTPQSVHRMGGYRVQGKEEAQRQQLRDDARAVEEAGAFAVVLEGMPADLAGEITEELTVPTIGIGAGPRCDGQVLVMHDLLGLFEEFRPKFVKRFGELKRPVRDAIRAYADEVRRGKFPGREHSF
jgi:3-methyl-2-oxobutanoate hydroxymethyltransferase